MFLPIGDNVEKRVIPVVSMMLIVINVIVLLYETRVLAIDGEYALHDLLMVFGLVPADLRQGKVLGLLTHMFLHGGMGHLIGNMIVLWAFCATLENGLGAALFVALYVAWGIAGGMAHAAMNWDETMPLVGASGAIAGAIGAYCVAYGPASSIRCLLWIGFRPIQVQVPASVFCGFWLMQQVFNASFEVDGYETNVAWFAHLGGFGAGVVTMWLVRGETQTKLVEGADGSLILRTKSKNHGDAYGDVLAVPNECPHCGGRMDESDRMSETLARCPHLGCERLVYLEGQLVG